MPPGPESKLTMGEVLPRLLEAAQEQDGSRFLQMRLDSGDVGDRDLIFVAALPGVVKLASDAFGNFVVQKLFEKGSEEQQRQLVEKFKGEVLELAMHRFGCRVIQKTLELLSNDLRKSFIEELADKVVECVENMHGNHVIQKSVEFLAPDVDFIINALAGKAAHMASHQYGCRAIQRLLENCPPEQLSPLLDGISSCIEKLARDKHGNYVVQCVLEHGRLEDKRKILEVISMDLVDYAKNKVSSNVVERCFQFATVGVHADDLQEDRALLMAAMIGEPGDANSPLQKLMHDKFGNYTVQCVIKYSRGADREELRRRILSNESELKDSQTGRHILSALKDMGKTPAPEASNSDEFNEDKVEMEDAA